MLIPGEAQPHFENLIYMPMLLTILSKDRQIFEKGSCKFNDPYIKLVDKALERVQADLKISSDYLRANKMKLIKGKTEETVTTYTFIYQGYEDQRRYLNARLKNRTAELMELYLLY
ncbi:hypothetical protein QT711_11145 [Sporosarcina saromensis]|uniref:YolD-like protein n=1 Tax=Sporosarcina saromensis TaxID=359365 RepID=A0ABU4G9S7_9BACL|nr:hypothetical protein [Sporosarcina saromensis]MDW0113743.1 hypothetical protein [Sporosarcina saromensis]